MTATSPVNAIVYPTLADVKDQVAQFATMNTNIDKSALPRFANASARNAAFPTPTEGQMAYLNTEGVQTYYTGTAWVVLEQQRTLIKTVTENITAADTVANNDDVLYFYAQANSAYTFETNLHYVGITTGPDAIAVSYSFPSGATAKRTILAPGTGQTARASCTSYMRLDAANLPINTGGTTGGSVIWERGILITGATPGLFQLVWSKPSAYAGTLSMNAGSWMTYRKIS